MEKFNEFSPKSDFNLYHEQKTNNIKEEFKINNENDLVARVDRVIKNWNKSEGKDEGSLRDEEIIIYEALGRLNLEESWINDNKSLFVKLAGAADDLKLIKLVKEKFSIEDASSKDLEF
jgi:hypothetical protein